MLLSFCMAVKTSLGIVLLLASASVLSATAIDRSQAVNELLQAPAVVKAACSLTDITSGQIITDEGCSCNNGSVACDVGPIVAGDIQLTYCNKRPGQDVEDLLVLKFACNPDDGACGKGTPCDLGPILYGNDEYYLCINPTSAVNDHEICVPDGWVVQRPDEDGESRPSQPTPDQPTSRNPDGGSSTPGPTPAQRVSTEAPRTGDGNPDVETAPSGPVGRPSKSEREDSSEEDRSAGPKPRGGSAMPPWRPGAAARRRGPPNKRPGQAPPRPGMMRMGAAQQRRHGAPMRGPPAGRPARPGPMMHGHHPMAGRHHGM